MDGKILVVDDEDYTREIIKTIFNGEDIEVVAAKDGYEAIAKIKKTDFDVLAMDIRMPGLDGVETIAQIRKIDPKISIFIMTGYGNLDVLEKTKKDYDVYEVVAKPFDIDALMEIVKKGIEMKRKAKKS